MELFWIFAGLTIIGLICYALQLAAVRSYTSQPVSSSGEGASLPLPPISILKPLRGLDDNLFDNLESFCLLDYPEYEIIFALQDYNDPAYKVAHRVKDKYPGKNISLVVERCNAGLNPKVNNLIPAYKASRYGHILISDSNVMAGKDYLKEMAKHLSDPEVGLVSSIIRGVGARTPGSVFENLHLNSFIIGSVCFLDKFLKIPCVIGKSMLMKKSDLEALGGLKAFKDVLAEDYIIGKKMKESGKKVALSTHAINNVNHYWGIKKFMNRHTRWGKLRWRIGGIRYMLELFGNPVFMSFIPLLLTGISDVKVSFAIIVGLIKICGDIYIGERIGSEMNPLLYLLSPVKDIVIGIVWFIPIIDNTVVWRGNRYIIGKDSALSPIQEGGMWSLKHRVFNAIRARLA